MLIPKSTGKETYLCTTLIHGQIAFNNILFYISYKYTLQYTFSMSLPSTLSSGFIWVFMKHIPGQKRTNQQVTDVHKLTKYVTLSTMGCHQPFITLCFCHKKMWKGNSLSLQQTVLFLKEVFYHEYSLTHQAQSELPTGPHSKLLCNIFPERKIKIDINYENQP